MNNQIFPELLNIDLVWFIVFFTSFNNILVISWRSVYWWRKPEYPRENHKPVASHRQTLAHTVVWFSVYCHIHILLICLVCCVVFNITFNNYTYIVTVGFIGGCNRGKPPTCRKPLINFITYYYTSLIHVCIAKYVFPIGSFGPADL
jgi:hypothetical protein